MNIEIPNNISESAAAEIQAIIDREAKDQSGAFVPKYGEKYWVIALHSKDSVNWYEWEADDIDKERFILGHCFPTAVAALAAAPAYLAKLDAQYAIALWLAEHQDWLSTDAEGANPSAMKFHVIHRRKEGRSVLVVKGWSSFEPLGVTIFRTRDHAEQFIAECGDHLRVVFGLPKEEGK